MITHTIGAILAGGSSSRMGRDKSALVVGGTSFLERIHDTFRDVFTEVIVCGGSAVPPDGVLIRDEVPGEGPLGGLLSAMRIARGRPVFVSAVDMPMLTTETIHSLAEPVAGGTTVRIARVNGRDQPLLGVYGPGVQPLARSRFDSGRRSVFGILDDIGDVARVEVDSDGVFNVNTEADYDRLIERWGL